MTKKQVAKEWLYFLGCFCFGLLIFPSLLYLIFRLLSNKEDPQFFFQFYSVVVGGSDALLAWSFVLAPYLIFQLVRSVIWGWRPHANHSRTSRTGAGNSAAIVMRHYIDIVEARAVKECWNIRPLPRGDGLKIVSMR